MTDDLFTFIFLPRSIDHLSRCKDSSFTVLNRPVLIFGNKNCLKNLFCTV